MSPITPRRRAILGVHSRISLSAPSLMVCVGMEQAESPECRVIENKHPIDIGA